MRQHKHHYFSPVKAATARRQYILHSLVELGLPLFFLASISLALILPHRALAATYNWDGGGTTNNWSDCANWSSDTCPGSADTVTFSSTSTKNSTVDASFGGTVANITSIIGYTGTISLSRSLTVSSAYTQGVGTFNAGSQAFTVGGGFSLSGGTFTASSGTTQVNSTFTISGSPTFNANGGTFAFGGTTNVSLSCNNVTFNLVQFVHTANTKTVSSNCSLPLGNNPSMFAVTLSGGTLSGTGTLTGTSNLNLGSGSVLSGFSGLVVAGTFTLNTSLNLGSYTTVDFNGSFLMNSGTFTAPSGTATFASTFTISGGTFNANGGTVTFDVGTATLSCNGATFNLVTFNMNNTKTVSSNCSLPLGSNPTISGTSSIVLNGTLSGSGLLSAYTLTLNSGSTLSGFSGLAATNALTVNSVIDFSAYATFTVGGAFAINSGANFTAPSSMQASGTFALNSGATFTASSGTASFSSTFTINSGATFNANGGTVSLIGGGTTIACGGVTFSSVILNPLPGNTKTVGSDCTLPLGANPSFVGGIIVNGTLSGSGTISTNTSVTLNSGATLTGFSGFSQTGGTLNMATALNASSYSPFTTFGFTLSSGANFTAPSGLQVNNNFTLSSGATFTAPSGTANFAGNFTLNSGSTFNANGGTIAFSSGSNTLACNNVAFNLVTINKSGNGTVTVGSDCSLPLGANPTVATGSGNLIVNGTLSGSGTFTRNGAGSFTLNISSVFSGFSGLVINNHGTFTLGGIAWNFGAYTTFDVNAPFVLQTGGSFTAPSGTMSVSDSFTLNASTTFNANGGILVLDGGGASGGGGGTITCNNAVFNSVAITSSNSSKIISSDCNLPLGNNPVANNGTGNGITLNGTLSGSGLLAIGAVTTNFTLNSGGTLSGFSGLVVTGTLTVNGAYDFSNYSTFQANSTATINASASLTTPTSGAIFGAGFINVGTFNASGRTVTFNGSSSSISCSGTTTWGLVVLANTGLMGVNSCTLPLGNNPTVGNRISLSGTLSGSGTLTQNGSLTINSGGVLAGFSGLALPGTTSSTLSISGGTVDLAAYTTVNIGSFLLQSGSFKAPSTTPMYVNNSFEVDGGSTFNANSGTIILSGTNQAVHGDVTFYNLTKESPGSTLTFDTTSTTTILGQLRLRGSTSSPLMLASSSPGLSANLAGFGTNNICYVSVTDSSKTGTTLVAYQSTSYSINLGWAFLNSACPGTEDESGSGGEPTSTTANYISAQASAAVISASNAASVDTPLLPNAGTLRRTGSVLGAVFKSDRATKAFLSFIAAVAAILLLVGGIWWVLYTRKHKHEE